MNRKALVQQLVKKSKGVITPKEIVEAFGEKGVEISEAYAAVLKSNAKRTLVEEGVTMKETKKRGRPPKTETEANAEVKTSTPATVAVKRRGRPAKTTDAVKESVKLTKKNDEYDHKIAKIAEKMTATGEACDTDQKNAELVGRIFMIRSKLVEAYDAASIDAAWKRVSQESIN